MDDKVLTQFEGIHGGTNEKGKYSRHYRYFVTINSPLPVFNHEYIKEMLSHLKLKYWCMSDEIGESGNYHTHIYFESTGNVIRWDTVKKLFHTAYIVPAFATAQQLRDYILKVGTHASKAETSVEGSFEEWNEIPLHAGKKQSNWDRALEMLDAGNTVYEIIRAIPEMANNEITLGRLREMIIEEEYRDVERDLKVTYIQGNTSTGKTTYISKKYGHSNICRITTYKHGCFNKYQCEDVMVFEEFASKFDIEDMLNYLDKFPLELPCKYYNKIACYTKLYMSSNLPLEKQYADVKAKNPEVYAAWLRRITKIMVFVGLGEYVEFETTGSLKTGDIHYASDKYFQALADGKL